MATRKRVIGQILVVTGLAGMAVSFLLISVATQQLAFWCIGSIIMIGDGIYVMKL